MANPFALSRRTIAVALLAMLCLVLFSYSSASARGTPTGEEGGLGGMEKSVKDATKNWLTCTNKARIASSKQAETEDVGKTSGNDPTGAMAQQQGSAAAASCRGPCKAAVTQVARSATNGQQGAGRVGHLYNPRVDVPINKRNLGDVSLGSNRFDKELTEDRNCLSDPENDLYGADAPAAQR